jgi:hypothetical protein
MGSALGYVGVPVQASWQCAKAVSDMEAKAPGFHRYLGPQPEADNLARKNKS